MSTTATDSADLRELSDPDFFACWAKVRLRYATARAGSAAHERIKPDYDGVLAEYRRRLGEGAS